MTSTRALIVAGGTGGHIFPGLSVAKVLQDRGWQVQWAGNPNAMEGRLVPNHHIELKSLEFAGFRGKGLVSQLLMPFRLLKALWQARQILVTYKPQVVLGMGGYVAFPMGLAARLCGVPLIVHEQNSVAGLTNRVLARWAARNLVAFPHALPQASWVGNPVRAELLAQPAPAERFVDRTGPLRVLVVGGSLGAQALNQVVPAALALLPVEQRPVVTHQSGKNHGAALQTFYQALNVSANVVEFIEDMASAFVQADVVICRAGAMTVAEVAAIGVAALFVPFPHAVDDHQTHNATFLVREGAAWLKQQSELDAQWLSSWLSGLDRARCEQVAEKARALAKPQAAVEVADILEQVKKA